MHFARFPPVFWIFLGSRSCFAGSRSGTLDVPFHGVIPSLGMSFPTETLPKAHPGWVYPSSLPSLLHGVDFNGKNPFLWNPAEQGLGEVAENNN